jgi:hypothetical protein
MSPLPSSFISSEERELKSAVTSSYFDAREIEDNSTAEIIICGEPDDHMVAGYFQFGERDEDGKQLTYCTREEPDQETWVKRAGLGYMEKGPKEDILKEIAAATDRKSEWNALSRLARPQYFLGFAAWHCEREEFVCMKVTQAGLLKDIERYLRMEEDYMPMSKGGVYNFRMVIEKKKEDRVSYSATVRIHRKNEKPFIDKLILDWDSYKETMWLPRYFMPKGQNNIFEGKPTGATMPAGLPVMARDEYGADEELKGF